MSLEHQISILKWFLKDRVTLKTVMMLKIQLRTTGINNISKYNKIENCYFKMWPNNISQ